MTQADAPNKNKSPAADSKGLSEPIEINLRDPFLAAFLAWLWPGAGHLYQRRYAKGILFMVCIVSTFFFGLSLGGGRVVYASWTKEHKNIAYLAQVGTGLPALPALVQTHRVGNRKAPLFGGVMAPPKDYNEGEADELASWHAAYPWGYEIGKYYTVIAGLLNVLVIYDAFSGPVVAEEEEPEKKPGDKDNDGKSKSKDK